MSDQRRIPIKFIKLRDVGIVMVVCKPDEAQVYIPAEMAEIKEEDE